MLFKFCAPVNMEAVPCPGARELVILNKSFQFSNPFFIHWPRLASPRLASPRLASPRLALPYLNEDTARDRETPNSSVNTGNKQPCHSRYKVSPICLWGSIGSETAFVCFYKIIPSIPKHYMECLSYHT